MNRRTPVAAERGGEPLWMPDAAAELRYPDIRDLASRLHFSWRDGRIWLDDRRMVLIHSGAMGSLRRELIDSLGMEQARGLLTRMGYASGARDAELARKVRPNGSMMDAFVVGPQLHMLEGVVQVHPVRIDMDVSRGRFFGEFIWEGSSEDEEHINIYGVGNEPVCWMQLGYAAGYTSGFMGRQIVYREVECRAMGHPHCRIVGKPLEEWDDPEEDLRYFQAEPFANRTVGLLSGRRTADLDGAGGAAEATDIRQVVGASAGFNAVCHMVRRVAPTRATALFLGESGVGKEIFARALHEASERAAGPFVAVNCAAIPEHLVEAELFGVEKGAFTGALHSRMGRFERASGGTLFLDEIGTLSPVAQGKLLRALQEGEIERVGDTRTRKVDVRVIAATNVDLREEVGAGRFRQDLYFRLNVFPIQVPPLRHRRDDIPLLMNYFLRRFCTRHGRRVTGFTERAVEAMLNYHLPGNVRELENLVERGVVLAPDDGPIDTCHLFTCGEEIAGERFCLDRDGGLLAQSAAEGWSGDAGAVPDGGGDLSLDAMEERMLREAMARTQGNLSAAARLLGITRPQLAYRLKKKGIGL